MITAEFVSSVGILGRARSRTSVPYEYTWTSCIYNTDIKIKALSQGGWVKAWVYAESSPLSNKLSHTYSAYGHLKN